MTLTQDSIMEKEGRFYFTSDQNMYAEAVGILTNKKEHKLIVVHIENESGKIDLPTLINTDMTEKNFESKLKEMGLSYHYSILESLTPENLNLVEKEYNDLYPFDDRHTTLNFSDFKQMLLFKKKVSPYDFHMVYSGLYTETTGFTNEFTLFKSLITNPMYETLGTSKGF